MLLGLGTVSKLLTWLLRRARGVTLAALSGLMLGSLRRLWPFLALPPGTDAGALPLHAVPKVPPAELAQVPRASLPACCWRRWPAPRWPRSGWRSPALRGPFIGRPRPPSLMDRLACPVCVGARGGCSVAGR